MGSQSSRSDEAGRPVQDNRVTVGSRVETVGWVLPIDDTSFRIYTAGRVTSPGEIVRQRSRLNGKLWEELTPEEHQRFPGDHEAQVGQGAITLHSEEHLVSSDRGVALVRRALRRQLEIVGALERMFGIDALETSLLIEHLQALRAGKMIEVPSYDFTTHSRRPERRRDF